jgi:lysozyme family protein
MKATSQSTRRAFLKGGALAAAPLAAAGAAAVMAADEHQARLARLEAEAEVRALHQDWLRKVNTGDRAEAARLHETVSRVDTDHSAAPDEIALAADGKSASGRYACVVETQTELAKDCTLAQMRHAQGEGSLRQSERRVLKADYVKTDGRWAIARLRFEPA